MPLHFEKVDKSYGKNHALCDFTATLNPGVSVLLYVAAMLVYGVVCGALLWFNWGYTLGIIVLLVAIYLLTAYLSICRFLKKNILFLIT